ncbi:hypothetical protein EDD90_10479 [Streptomyces sp. Ag109_O5-1]|uniref:hypothetical protein n=1 Tax=Streptomyces sp. Ag109_O5-1 TaxID=1938851 RepID=UPI000F97B759|nr:hypothetical protein [Streptomyces sp. Ag109_O5-1]RPE47055.1 hypothetical protein EDD90_10479 [Streptomyces sp. Ag109_O5-1]
MELHPRRDLAKEFIRLVREYFLSDDPDAPGSLFFGIVCPIPPPRAGHHRQRCPLRTPGRAAL